jgi:hypothetical protein
VARDTRSERVVHDEHVRAGGVARESLVLVRRAGRELDSAHIAFGERQQVPLVLDQRTFEVHATVPRVRLHRELLPAVVLERARPRVGEEVGQRPQHFVGGDELADRRPVQAVRGVDVPIGPVARFLGEERRRDVDDPQRRVRTQVAQELLPPRLAASRERRWELLGVDRRLVRDVHDDVLDAACSEPVAALLQRPLPRREAACAERREAHRAGDRVVVVGEDPAVRSDAPAVRGGCSERCQLRQRACADERGAAAERVAEPRAERGAEVVDTREVVRQCRQRGRATMFTFGHSRDILVAAPPRDDARPDRASGSGDHERQLGDA